MRGEANRVSTPSNREGIMGILLSSLIRSLPLPVLTQQKLYGFGVGDCTDRGRVLSGAVVVVVGFGCGLVRLTGALR